MIQEHRNSGILKAGDRVRFVGERQYINSYERAPSIQAQPCTAEITAVRDGHAHPYRLNGPHVNGWVSAADVLDLQQE